MLLHWIVVVIVGFVVGLIARFLTPGRDPEGFIVTTLIGIGGALLASFVGQKMGWYTEGQPAGFIAALVGAIVRVLLLRAMRRRR